MSPAARDSRAGAVGAWLPWLVLLLAVVDWRLLRAGALFHPSWLLAAIVASSMTLFGWRLAIALRRLKTGEVSRVGGLGGALAITGVLLALGAGLTNWLLRFDGFVILQEGVAVSLRQGGHLQHLEAGPLAGAEALDLVFELEELELRPGAAGFFYPASRLVVSRVDGGSERLEVHPRASAATGALRFYQGAFGFAPRIVILRDGATVFDEIVPFTTERREGPGISFEGELTIASEALRVVGALDLSSLDEAVRGHATLHLTVEKEGELIGRGSLLPGRFAAIERDYRVGFAGLGKWSEIDVSRRQHRGVMLSGLSLALGGAILATIAAWRGR